MSRHLPNPQNFTHEQLRDVVRDIQYILWMSLCDDGLFRADPDKEWDVEFLDMIAHVLRDAGLAFPEDDS